MLTRLVRKTDAIEAMQQCIEAIQSWMIKDKLRLNDNKTEFMIIGTRKQLAKVNIDGLSVSVEHYSSRNFSSELGIMV